MPDEYSFPPYGANIIKILKGFGGEKPGIRNGDDITPLRDLTGADRQGAAGICTGHPGLKSRQVLFIRSGRSAGPMPAWVPPGISMPIFIPHQVRSVF